MRTCGRIGALAVLGLIGVSVPAWADEEKVALDKVPVAVMNAVKAKFPGATLKSAAKEEDKGQTIYEVSLTDRGQAVDVSVKPEGMIVSVERTIKVSDLPAGVTAALNKKYPKAELESAEEVTEGDKVTFEVVVETADDKKFEVVLDRSGKILKEEAKTDKDDKDEKDEKGDKTKKGD